jgi:hypothetical protein
MAERSEMDIVKEIEELLALQDPYEKRARLERLSDVFEYNLELNGDVVQGVQSLLTGALSEKDERVKEALFHAINNAVVYYEGENIGSRIDWDMMVAALSSLEKDCLIYALSMLGLSGQKRYLQILNAYVQNADPAIKTWALDAISDLEVMLEDIINPPATE